MIDRSKRQQVIDDVSRLGVSGVTLDASYNGKAITPAVRDELLAKLAANQHVEIELELLAFEQKPGEHNRKNIRIRDGAMMAAGRSGKGRPFLRDHAQGSLLARGGTILESATEKRGEGDYAIKQRARLSAPWAVDAALRGLLDGISVGIYPTGPIECSVCGTEVFDACWHCPGEQLEAAGDKPAQVVEWIYSAAELVETSAVNVPAVPSAHIESIRAALSAQQTDNHPTRPIMNPKFASLLLLAATASETEVLSAVENTVRERDAIKAELGIARKELEIANAEKAILSGEKTKTAADKFIADAIASGRITLAAEPEWRNLFGLAPDRAAALMASKPEGIATPVGQPRQSNSDPAPAPAPASETGLGADAKAVLARGGIDGDAAVKFATAFGATKAVETITAGLGLKKGA